MDMNMPSTSTSGRPCGRNLRPRFVKSGKRTPKKTGVGRRRIIFKNKKPVKALRVSGPVTRDFLFYCGTYYQIGDIVSVIGTDNYLYYCQIHGLMQDTYNIKSAELYWLIPSQCSPEDHFDPATYTIGPKMDNPLSLDCIELECRAPLDYFRPINAPYHTISFNLNEERGYIWTRLMPIHHRPRYIGDNAVDSTSAEIDGPSILDDRDTAALLDEPARADTTESSLAYKRD